MLFMTKVMLIKNDRFISPRNANYTELEGGD